MSRAPTRERHPVPRYGACPVPGHGGRESTLNLTITHRNGSKWLTMAQISPNSSSHPSPPAPSTRLPPPPATPVIPANSLPRTPIRGGNPSPSVHPEPGSPEPVEGSKGRRVEPSTLPLLSPFLFLLPLCDLCVLCGESLSAISAPPAVNPPISHRLEKSPRKPLRKHASLCYTALRQIPFGNGTNDQVHLLDTGSTRWYRSDIHV